MKWSPAHGNESLVNDHWNLSEVRVLVTGATGFVGSALITRLMADPHLRIRAAVRRDTPQVPAGVEQIEVGDISATTDWRAAVSGIDVIVHLAARVHVMRDTTAMSLTEFRKINVDGTRSLAVQAASSGVRRLVYLSSIKVNGETGRFTESDAPSPVTAYGVSKYEAEEMLEDMSLRQGMQFVVIRPPLVYGPGAKANFRRLARAVARGIPLPLGAVHNRRSLVGIDNLVDFITTCIAHEGAANQRFLVSDGADMSTTDLILGMAQAMNRRAHIIPVPVWMLSAIGIATGSADLVSRLIGNLELDIAKARRILDWSPPFRVEEELRQAVAEFRAPIGDRPTN